MKFHFSKGETNYKTPKQWGEIYLETNPSRKPYNSGMLLYLYFL